MFFIDKNKICYYKYLNDKKNFSLNLINILTRIKLFDLKTIWLFNPSE
jgi:hypothetical protein